MLGLDRLKVVIEIFCLFYFLFCGCFCQSGVNHERESSFQVISEQLMQIAVAPLAKASLSSRASNQTAILYFYKSRHLLSFILFEIFNNSDATKANKRVQKET